jgi:hypothetical protein
MRSETGGRKGRLVHTVIHSSAVPKWFPEWHRAGQRSNSPGRTDIPQGLLERTSQGSRAVVACAR